MDKETSSRVSSIAAEILKIEPIDPELSSTVERSSYNWLLDQAKTLAGSALSQDETPGQATKKPPRYIIEKIQDKKLPNFPPAFQLCIQINASNHFATGFNSLADLADPEIWQAGCDRMHESLIKWLHKLAENEHDQ